MLRNYSMARRWRGELAGARAGELVKSRVEQTASRSPAGVYPAPNRGMTGDAGKSSRQTSGGVDGERHPARLPSGIPM